MVFSGIENARLVSRAVIGNAFEHLPSSYGAYIRAMEKEAPVLYNPDGKELTSAIIEQTSFALSKRNYTKDSLLTVPWSLRREQKNAKIKPSRVAASIIAFSDVQGKRVVDEFFPVEQMQTFLDTVKSQVSYTHKPLTIPEQFAIALEITNNNPVAASLLAHSAYRAIARGKDTKISPKLIFPLEEVVDFARSTADLHTTDSPSRDPLGDTYHWWASFSAGLVFTLSKEKYPIQSRLYTTAFYHEAALTTFVRKNMLHKTQLINHHKDVDRQGLQAGITVGNFLKLQ